MSSHIPLIVPKAIWHFSDLEYRKYIEGLREQYKEDARAKAEAKSDPKTCPIKGVSFYIHHTGTHVITIRNRKPKYLTPTEIDAMADHYGIDRNIMWTTVHNKKIDIKK